MLTRQNVMISIHTSRRGISIPLFRAEGAAEAEDEAPFDELTPADLPDWEEENTGEPEQTDLLMEGKLITTSRRIELVYHESELTGMEGAITKIGFERSMPGLISMLRSGTVSTALVFEEGRRHICVYHTPISSFEVCVQTLGVQNRLPEEGALSLEYLIELHGLRTEHCRMQLRVCEDATAP